MGGGVAIEISAPWTTFEEKERIIDIKIIHPGIKVKWLCANKLRQEAGCGKMINCLKYE